MRTSEDERQTRRDGERTTTYLVEDGPGRVKLRRVKRGKERSARSEAQDGKERGKAEEPTSKQHTFLSV